MVVGEEQCLAIRCRGLERLRGKLAAAGCERLVETVPMGGYRLSGEVPFMFARAPAEADRLDRYLREIDWQPANTVHHDKLAQNPR